MTINFLYRQPRGWFSTSYHSWFHLTCLYSQEICFRTTVDFIWLVHTVRKTLTTVDFIWLVHTVRKTAFLVLTTVDFIWLVHTVSKQVTSQRIVNAHSVVMATEFRGFTQSQTWGQRKWLCEWVAFTVNLKFTEPYNIHPSIGIHSVGLFEMFSRWFFTNRKFIITFRTLKFGDVTLLLT